MKKSGTPLDSQLSLKLIPKVKVCRLIEVAPKGQSLQAAWQRPPSQSLIKVEPEGQTLQAAW